MESCSRSDISALRRWSASPSTRTLRGPVHPRRDAAWLRQPSEGCRRRQGRSPLPSAVHAALPIERLEECGRCKTDRRYRRQWPAIRRRLTEFDFFSRSPGSYCCAADGVAKNRAIAHQRFRRFIPYLLCTRSQEVKLRYGIWLAQVHELEHSVGDARACADVLDGRNRVLVARLEGHEPRTETNADVRGALSSTTQ